MILIVGAVAQEVEWLQGRAQADILICGVGPIEAGVHVARTLARSNYDAVINVGIGGSLRADDTVGSAVIVGDDRMEIDCEDGSPLILPGGTGTIMHARSDEGLCAAVSALGFPLRRGITVSRVTTTHETADRLRRVADVESMEGFAVLRAANLADVPALQLRGISNIVGPRDAGGWDLAAGINALRTLVNATLDVLYSTIAHDE